MPRPKLSMKPSAARDKALQRAQTLVQKPQPQPEPQPATEPVKAGKVAKPAPAPPPAPSQLQVMAIDPRSQRTRALPI